MKEKTQKIIFWAVFGPPLAYGLYILSVIYSRPTKLLAAELGSPAIAYAAELKEHSSGRAPRPCDAQRPGLTESEKLNCYQKNAEFMRTAPDGSAELKLELAPYTNILESCYELWIDFKDGNRKRVMKLYAGDPGSGLYFSWSQGSIRLRRNAGH
jgi:hypothetical protein